MIFLGVLQLGQKPINRLYGRDRQSFQLLQ